MKTLTPEQSAFLEALLMTNDNLVLEAVAGSGKSFTLEKGLAELQREGLLPSSVLVCAFNKHIEVAFTERVKAAGLPVSCRTMNSLGHSAFGRAIGRRLTLETGKLYLTAKELWPRFDTSPMACPDFKKLVDAARNTGIVPAGSPGGAQDDTEANWAELFENADIDSEDWDPSWLIECARTLLARMNMRAWDGVIDFTDQLYLPVTIAGRFDTYKLVMVDEAQDLGTLQHRMLRKLLGLSGRLVAAGDRNQAIYGFRGADVRSIPNMITQFGLRPMPLTVSFRCPKAVVRQANEIVPYMKSAPDAPEGHVGISKPSDIRPGDFILCRYNQPLAGLWLRLIKRNIPATILGKDIGAGLARLLKKRGANGNEAMPLGEALQHLDAWLSAETAKHLGKGKHDKAESLTDRCAAIHSICEAAPTDAAVSWFSVKIENLFSDRPGSPAVVTLSTIHKAKGLEYRRVHFLGREKLPPQRARGAGRDQEHNLIYVGETRAMLELYFMSIRSLAETNETADLTVEDLFAPRPPRLPSVPSLAAPTPDMSREEELAKQQKFLESRKTTADISIEDLGL
jgi:superfamily I DNA/RNA helicase